jgi:polysaccharide export outer membrane protein
MLGTHCFGVTAAGAGVVGCAAPAEVSGGSNALAARGKEAGALGTTTVGAGDVLEVRIFREPDLSGTYQVSVDGTIHMPLVDEVKVAGLPPALAAETIAQRYADGYLAAPQVIVFVKEYNSKRIYVMGEVKAPGSFAYRENLTILQAVILAGGFTTLAATGRVLITRNAEGGEKKLEVSVSDVSRGEAENILLQPGDLVFVPEAIF